MIYTHSQIKSAGSTPLRIDWSNPITRGLVSCTVQGADLIGTYRQLGAPKAAARVIPYKSGYGIGAVSATAAVTSQTLSGTEFTADKLVFKQNSQAALLVFWNNADRFCGLHIDEYYFSIRYSNADYSKREVQYSVALLNDKNAYVQARVDCPSDTNELWVNGIFATPSSTTGTAQSAFSVYSLQQLSWHSGSSATALDRLWLRRLSDAELFSLQQNPWQIFAPAPRRSYSSHTVQLLRPASDISTGAWAPSTGTTLYGVIDESTPDDNDYMLTITNSTAEIKFAPGSTPSAGDIVIRYRAKNNGTGALTAYLYQGATLKATHNPTLTNTFQTFTWTLTSGEAASITDFTDLRIKFTSS